MPSNNFGFTHIDVKETHFTWKINNFEYLSSCLSTGSKLDSPTFTVKPDDDNEKWQLFLWPNGRNNTDVGFVSFSLNRLSSNVGLHIRLSLSLINTKGKKSYEKRLELNSYEKTYYNVDKFLPKSFLGYEPNDILLNNVLMVHCQLTIVYIDSFKKVDDSIHQQPIYPPDKLLDAFEQQLEKGEFSDVKLVASCGKELPAHKFVLAARSPVFSAMFTNDMMEKNDNSVTIKDLDYNSLKEMLRFMYAGKVNNIDEVIGGVLAAQEKYQIDGLKELCEEYFFNNLNADNAIDTLSFSIRYSLATLKVTSEKYIRCHAKDVSNSAAFKAIDEPNLLAEIVSILATV